MGAGKAEVCAAPPSGGAHGDRSRWRQILTSCCSGQAAATVQGIALTKNVDACLLRCFRIAHNAFGLGTPERRQPGWNRVRHMTVFAGRYPRAQQRDAGEDPGSSAS
jgi:hypothetical protein